MAKNYIRAQGNNSPLQSISKWAKIAVWLYQIHTHVDMLI